MPKANRWKCRRHKKTTFSSYRVANSVAHRLKEPGHVHWCAEAGGFHITRLQKGEFDRRQAAYLARGEDTPMAMDETTERAAAVYDVVIRARNLGFPASWHFVDDEAFPTIDPAVLNTLLDVYEGGAERVTEGPNATP